MLSTQSAAPGLGGAPGKQGRLLGEGGLEGRVGVASGGGHILGWVAEKVASTAPHRLQVSRGQGAPQMCRAGEACFRGPLLS